METKIYGHRGAMGEYPENTLLSFQAAIDQGVDGIELDVQLTKDGEIVVIHDEKIDRTTTGTGYVKDLTLGEIKQYSAGAKFKHLPLYEESWDAETVPTLREVLEMLEPYPEIELNIELKTNLVRYQGIEKSVLDTVDEFAQSRKVIYSSFHLPSILLINEYDMSKETAWLVFAPISHLDEYFHSLNLEGLHIAKDAILNNPYPFKDFSHKLRIWTVNETDEIKQLLDLKVDTIMTDFPEKAVFFRSEKALALLV